MSFGLAMGNKAMWIFPTVTNRRLSHSGLLGLLLSEQRVVGGGPAGPFSGCSRWLTGP